MKNKVIWIFVISALAIIIICIISYILFSPYHWSQQMIKAIEKDDIERVEQLLQKDFDVNTPNSKPNRIIDAFLESSPVIPLAMACEQGNYDMVKLLIDHGATASYIKGTGWSPLYEALWKYQPDDERVIPLLLDNGAAMCFKQCSDEQHILMAASDATPEVLQILERYGADIYDTDESGSNAVMQAALYHNNAVLEYVLDNKSFDVNAADINGQTALMMSVYFENEADITTIELLLAHGVDKAIKDNDGKTAYDYALENGNEAFADMLVP